MVRARPPAFACLLFSAGFLSLFGFIFISLQVRENPTEEPLIKAKVISIVQNEEKGLQPCPEWSTWSACCKGQHGESALVYRYRVSRPVEELCVAQVEFEECMQTEALSKCETNKIPRDVRITKNPCIQINNDCCVGEWSSWTSCTASCGLGIKTRRRVVLPIPSDGFEVSTTQLVSQCPLAYETNACEMKPCPTTPTKEYFTETERNWLRLTCNGSDALIYVDDGPFGRGYAKEAWRALYQGHDVVVKLPIDDDKLGRYLKGIDWEDKWFMRLNHPLISKYYGICRDGMDSFEVVEGGLAKWSFVAENVKIPWCLRVRMAMEVMELLIYLMKHAVIHCDWKYDQLAVDDEGHIRLVDVKSLRRLDFKHSERRPYKSLSHCSKDSTCQKCHKMAKLPLESSCNGSTGHCVGFGAPSMVAASSQLIFRQLFVNTTFPTPAFGASINNLMDQCERKQPTERPTFEEVHDALDKILREGDGENCFRVNKDLISDELKKSYDSMVSSYYHRCKNRYC
eukprot:m.74770 g.74770  ORF g.74770 m.74770 type:complete len:513 (+) comp12479_c0_seq5:262-1800(+)